MADTKQSEVTGSTKITVVKHRSPNFPVVGLRKALEHTKAIYDAYRRTPIPIELAHQKWNYKAHSGLGNQMVAALKAYDLIDVTGDGNNRKIGLSDRAYKIIIDHRDRQDLLRASALKPPIYDEIWGKYGSDGLPADDLLRHHLIERNFNPTSIKGIIDDFRDTITFAGISDGSINGSSCATDVGGNEPLIPEETVADQKIPAAASSPPKPIAATLPQGGPNMVTDTFNLEEGTVALQYPQSLSADSFEDFEAWVNLLLRKIKRRIGKPEAGAADLDESSQ